METRIRRSISSVVRGFHQCRGAMMKLWLTSIWLKPTRNERHFSDIAVAAASDPASTRSEQLEFLVSCPFIDTKIGVERENSRFLVDLSASDKGGVSERYRPVHILLEQ